MCKKNPSLFDEDMNKSFELNFLAHPIRHVFLCLQTLEVYLKLNVI